jgi:surface protein
MEEEIVGDQALEFVKPLKKITNYRQDQAELIKAALEVARDSPLNALKYIVSCLAHEGHEVEFHLVFNATKRLTLPIVETEPKDELGYYVSWGDGTITHNTNYHEYDYKDYKAKEHTAKEHAAKYHVRFFGFGIKSFGPYYYVFYNESERMGYCSLDKILSFGNLGHNFKSLSRALQHCQYITQIPNVIPSSVEDISYMFSYCGNINNNITAVKSWDTSNIKNMEGMFYDCYDFNQPLDSWDTSSVINMSSMFGGCMSFNQNINSWDTSAVTNMESMFYECKKFDQPLDSWDTSSVIDMSHMFYNCARFNQNINSWNTAAVTNMKRMFFECRSFDQPLNSWDVSSVTNMTRMFNWCCKFNQSLISWNVANVTDMGEIFYRCSSFNQPLDSWAKTEVFKSNKQSF